MIGLQDEIQRFSKYGKRSRISKKNFFSSKLGDGVSLDSKFEDLDLSVTSKSWNALLFVALLVVFVLLFLAKAFNLQVIFGSENRILADGNRIRITNIMAERGLLLDRNGNVVVQNKPAFSIQMSTGKCRPQGLDACRSEYSFFQSKFNLDINTERVLEDIGKGKDPIVIASGLSKDEILPVETLLSDYPLFSVSVTPLRDYLYKDAFLHLLGYRIWRYSVPNH